MTSHTYARTLVVDVAVLLTALTDAITPLMVAVSDAVVESVAALVLLRSTVIWLSVYALLVDCVAVMLAVTAVESEATELLELASVVVRVLAMSEAVVAASPATAWSVCVVAWLTASATRSAIDTVSVLVAEDSSTLVLAAVVSANVEASAMDCWRSRRVWTSSPWTNVMLLPAVTTNCRIL